MAAAPSVVTDFQSVACRGGGEKGDDPGHPKSDITKIKMI